MAIKIGGTTVIDNSGHSIVNQISGIYNDLIPSVVSAAGTIINMINPSITRSMPANETYSFTSRQRGRMTVLFLDTTSSSFTPTFPSEQIFWAGDVVPNWSSTRYWLITFIAWDSSNVQAAATGYN